MSIEWVDSFDHYGTGATGRTNMIAGPYAQLVTAGADVVTPSATKSRTGDNSLRIDAENSNTQFRRAFSEDLTDVIIGYAVNLDNLPVENTHMIAGFAGSGGGIHFSVNLNTVGGIQTYTDSWNGGTFIEQSGPVITPLGWYYIEIKVHHDATLGSYEIRVNNTTVLSKTNVDTGTSTAQMVITSAGSAVSRPGSGFYMDDLYCVNPNGGGRYTDFLGDVRVYTLFTDGDTASADWTPSSGTDLYAMVDETPPDGDTTYLESTAIDDAYELTYEDLPDDVVNVYGLVRVVNMKKTDSGSAGITLSMDSDGTVVDGTEKSITTEYSYWQEVFETDPDVSGAWTRTSINAVKGKAEQTS